MDLFLNAMTVRLLSYRDRYLVAEDDRVTVSQGSDGSAMAAVWTVEFVEGKDCIRLKSCYGTYLTATATAFLPGFSAKMVVQAGWPSAASEWEPLRDGMQVPLRSMWGYFLRPHAGFLPWRNAVTHDVPNRSKKREEGLWNVHVVEKCPARIRNRCYSGNGESGGDDDNKRSVLLNRKSLSSAWAEWMHLRNIFTESRASLRSFYLRFSL